MLAANMYANADDALDYAGKPARPTRRRRAVRPRRRLPPVPHRRRLAVPRRHHRRRVATVPPRSIGPTSPPTPASPTARRAPPRRRAGAEHRRPLGNGRRRRVGGALRRRRRRRRAGRRGDARASFFAHDAQVLANDFTPECTHTRFGLHRRWGPIVRVNGGPDRLPARACSPASRPTRSSAGLGRSPDEIDRAAHGPGRRQRTGRLGLISGVSAVRRCRRSRPWPRAGTSCPATAAPPRCRRTPAPSGTRR